MVTKLKVNVCSLMAESRVIRKQIERFKRESPLKGADPECQELISHRRGSLRNESRAAQLLYAFVRGKPYREVEPKMDDQTWGWRDTCLRLWRKCRKAGVDVEDVQKWLCDLSCGTYERAPHGIPLSKVG